VISGSRPVAGRPLILGNTVIDFAMIRYYLKYGPMESANFPPALTFNMERTMRTAVAYNIIDFKPPLPRALSKAAVAKVGAAIEAHLAAVEALIAFLDEANTDVDAEPSLGWTPNLDQRMRANSYPGDDLEEEHDGREPDEDGSRSGICHSGI
jgi:hypothetical protein